MGFFFTVLALVVILALAWRYLGSYMTAVYSGRIHYFGFVERPLYRLMGTSPDREQSAARYAVSLIVFSGVSVLFTYAILRLQGFLPFNPEHLHGVTPALSWNTSVSFLTNTDWQNYAGGNTLSYLSQMTLVVQQFISPAVGIAVAIALVRGFSRRSSRTIGNFWVDVVRGVLYILIPVAFVAGIIFVAQGAVQTLAGPVTVHDALNGVTQVIPRGPVGFMSSIEMLGTNGGGFFNANLADPLASPTALTNFLSIVLMLAIPVALTYTLGKMVGSVRQGAAILMAMLIIFGVWVGFSTYAEHQPNPAVRAAGLVHQPTGNMEGKEARFGDTSSTLFDVSATQTSTGAIDGANESYTPIGGFGLLSGMMLGEVTPGGDGSGLYTILLFAIVADFVGGLMIGRTPEYLGKKIQAREVKLAGLGVLVMPITVLVFTAVAVAIPAGKAAASIGGPPGFTEILYAFTSMANNNGSAFAALSGNTVFYNIVGSVAMIVGRFVIIIPSLILAGALARQGVTASSSGTFRTDKPIFVGLLIGVILIVGGLTFFPAVALGPLLEELSRGRFF